MSTMLEGLRGMALTTPVQPLSKDTFTMRVRESAARATPLTLGELITPETQLRIREALTPRLSITALAKREIKKEQIWLREMISSSSSEGAVCWY